MKVGIVGGGVSALSAVRSLRNKGISCVAFEKGNDIGGLWKANYLGSGLQVPKEFYEFPDFRFSNDYSNKSIPPREAVQKYIVDFAEKFNLKDHVKLNSEVTNIKQLPTKEWEVTVNGKDKQVFQHLIIATGLYSSSVNLPKLKGKDAFESTGGKVLHSSEFLDGNLVQNKDVLIVGGGKSAVDITLAVKDLGAKSSTNLFREAHWMTPIKIMGLIPFEYIFLSRFGVSLVSLYQGFWPDNKKQLSIKAKSMMKPVFKLVEKIFQMQYGLKGDRKPATDVVEDVFNVAQFVGPELRRRVEAKDVVLRRGEIDHLESSRKVVLKDGAEMESDVIICATGFSKSYSIFDSNSLILKDLDVQPDGLYLYRHIISPKVPNLYFCGSEAACVFNVTSYALQAEWISRVIEGTVKLPSTQEMEESIQRTKEWKRSWIPDSRYRASMVILYHTNYHDALLEDMKVNPRRKTNFFSEFFAPYRSRDYDGIIASSSS